MFQKGFELVNRSTKDVSDDLVVVYVTSSDETAVYSVAAGVVVPANLRGEADDGDIDRRLSAHRVYVV
ncbi:hypothetical protein C0Q70_16755 [Pomacea canaliculata]|uniref:Uncharacterized protein n=1 Tax=Pomacea canaliculata TaxID=400727 RepID=A0A2T7NQR1_POMCA|nr:hypothetical protein C0Q70_16755 [Pomacea canaliculata]